jgi:hypothetical protein
MNIARITQEIPLERSYNHSNNLYKDRCCASTSPHIATIKIATDTVADCKSGVYLSEKNDDFSSDVVTICLTDNCNDCTGSYSNLILRHRIICKCHCHHKGNLIRSEVSQN